MDILDSKEIILKNINIIYDEYHRNKEDNNSERLRLIEETNELLECNKRLISEISEKDKLLIVNEKKMCDYEAMINQIQEEANQEKTEKERFDMLKKQDKEIHERDIEIQRLQKKVSNLEEKLIMLNKTSCVNDNIIEVRDEWKYHEKNSFYKESEKVDIAINAFSKHLGNDVTIEDVGNTSIGINGWYEEGMKEKTLLQKMKEIKTKEDDKQEDDKQEDDGEETEELTEEEIETEVIENTDDKKEDDGEEEEIETEVIENPDDKKEDDGEETEDLTEEEEVEIEILTYYKKEYYIITGEEPQYIYMIENGELGDKVGEVNGSKKIFYKSSKK